MNHIYIIECEDGTLYTGWTNNRQLPGNELPGLKRMI